MGVIQNLTNLNNTQVDSIEDVLNQIENDDNNDETPPPRIRRVRHRSRPLAIGGVPNAGARSGKKKKRIENSNYLLSLADPEEAFELSIHDFIPTSISVFSQVFSHQDNMDIWNDFINCTDPDALFQGLMIHQTSVTNNECVIDVIRDHNSKNPAVTAAECFRKIDNDLRALLRKKQVPMGQLVDLENDLVTFFVNRPQSVYQSFIPNSFKRLLLHALCQYMDLAALSYNRNGDRWTRVRNNNPFFIHPSILLSTYLEERLQQFTRNRHQ